MSTSTSSSVLLSALSQREQRTNESIFCAITSGHLLLLLLLLLIYLANHEGIFSLFFSLSLFPSNISPIGRWWSAAAGTSQSVSQLLSASLGLVRNLELLQDSRFPSGTVFFLELLSGLSADTTSLRHSKGSFDQVCCRCCCCWNSLEFSSCIYLSWHSVRFVRSFVCFGSEMTFSLWRNGNI